MPEVAHPARDYRLGDVVTGYVTRAHLRHPSTAPSRESTCERWPGTLACEYVSATPTDRNLTVLARLAEARNRDREWPNATTMTVHLRLGDVMEYEYYVRRGCRTACRYVRALDFYRGLAVPRSVRTAYVVTNTSFRLTRPSPASEAYLAAVVAALGDKGLAVQRWRGATPDEDFLFLTRAHWLVRSGGLFSTLASGLLRLQRRAVS